MSLIKCPECGKEISDSAKMCPNCGYEIEYRGVEMRKHPIYLVIKIAVFILAIIFMLIKSDVVTNFIAEIVAGGYVTLLIFGVPIIIILLILILVKR